MDGLDPNNDVPKRPSSHIKWVWRQGQVPVVYLEKRRTRLQRKTGLRVKLPYREGNKLWLQDGRRSRPKWDPQYKCWEIPRSWFQDTVDRCLSKFGKVYVIQRRNEQEKCAPACWNAMGHECECSCAGINHGMGHPDGRWFVVSETCAVKWRGRELSCRLLKINDNKGDKPCTESQDRSTA